MKKSIRIIILSLFPLAAYSQGQAGGGDLERLIAARDCRQAARIAIPPFTAGIFTEFCS